MNISKCLEQTPLTSLSINLIYLDKEGGCFRLEDIVKRKKHLQIQDFEDTQAFRDILGGIELVFSEHYIFYQSYDIYDLESAVFFLLETLDNEITKEKKKLYNSDYSYLEVEKKGDSIIVSYKPNLKTTSKNSRNFFYFDKLLINKKNWDIACKIALKEYFQIMSIYCEEDCLNDSFIKKLKNEWLRINNYI